ncbi:hypothetical protein ABFS82_10G059400 [Erythranthe guttata]|uniref:Transcription repressor n=1 Tax=Erythranthe guttata TaxID=4155 RepID=A0A022PP74_ERYGU|nr:PREDICTED: transcription repressor OFP15-like [Erythranthe guttata]EYU18097.1 hypothetical protein MIMGU_mgv1a025702mg [Erythranthe guttata]|eukprot:XP_012828687.1 PREDICTED: transcription repressor OFP15-like [Erythranthe guttata]
MKFPFLFRSTETPSTSSSATSAAAAAWPWPACVNNPKTLSFRADGNNIFKTMNSAFLDNDAHDSCSTVPDYSFQDDTFSGGGAPAEEETAVVGGLRSDRLFFEPGETTSRSILEEAKPYEGFPYKESHVAIMAVDSVDPFLDFRVSMEEMVAAHGLKEWDCLEEMLTCFLRVNGKSNHGYIVGAFVDLLLHLALSDSNNKKNNNGASSSSSISTSSAIDEQCSSSSTTTQYSFTSPLSFSSSTYSSLSNCLSLMENDDGNEIVADKNG